VTATIGTWAWLAILGVIAFLALAGYTIVGEWRDAHRRDKEGP
jgi:hypothetical protein